MTDDTSSTPLPSMVSDAFTAGVLASLQELFQLEGFIVTEIKGEDSQFSDGSESIVARILLRRDLPGELTLVMPVAVALTQAKRYLPAGTDLTDELVNDVVGEVANVVAGQGKTALKGTDHHFLLSTPSVTRSFEPIRPTESTWQAIFETEVGRIYLQVRLSPCSSASHLA
jgi:CheY-specific phosphatase CheX